MTEITKQKAGKPEWSLIMRHIPLALLAMIDVRRFGCEKYSAIAKAAGVEFDPEAWRKNSEQDYLDSAQRHVAALMRGEWTNTEDGGVLHAAQAMIDLAFMLEIRAQREACRLPQANQVVSVVLTGNTTVKQGQLVTADMLAQALEDATTFPTEPPSTQRSERGTESQDSSRCGPPHQPGDRLEVLASPSNWKAGKVLSCGLLGVTIEYDAGGITSFGHGMREVRPIADVIEKPNGDTTRAYLWADGGQELTLRIASPADLPPLRHMVETLSRKKRWADHCANAISVTRHHIHVKRIVDRLLERSQPGNCNWYQQMRRAALAHDMAEALYGDKPTPQKRLERSMLPDGVEHPHDILCTEFDRTFERKYDTAWMNHAHIKRADGIACCLEAVDRGVSRAQLCDWFPVELVTEALDGEWREVIQDNPWVGPRPDTEVWFNEWHNAGGKTS